MYLGYNCIISYDNFIRNLLMKKINLAITGCMGRMGRQIIKSVKSDKVFRLVSLTESKKLNKKINNVKITQNTIDSFKKADLIIDFTIPKCTFEVLKIASKLKKKVVIGTTGFSKKEENLIKNYSKKIPILKAGNMSLGINLLMYLTEIASNSLGKNFLSKIFEIHHKHKKDYPSGTALMLGKGIAKGRNKSFYDLIGKKFLNKKTFPYGNKLNFNSIRKGSIKSFMIKCYYFFTTRKFYFMFTNNFTFSYGIKI